ncbi:MAG: hypothetical protein E7B67_04105 [Veillonella sp.]|uniref:Uncharacterized protein n=1 Tax=Veillonella nakazawae TaxID=2682456 RepID=A0ABM7HAA1_9FIRM|nr:MULTISPECIES: hypothetical protein [Veillonella]MDU2903927.1 hypothetical protein [Veillonella sp.]MDU2931131.1 hypothetical protein [Veillonella sp.]MDU2965414.1 hypothetical protein [Veillonella sp.]BBU33931.1 hypothetical protein VEIT17_03770 [Veillonella nakazawae]
MNKKYFVLMLLSLALSSQFSLAATVDGVNPNTSAELKNNAKSNQPVQTKAPVKLDFIEIIPGAFKAVIRDKSINPKKLSIEDEITLERKEKEHASQRLKISEKTDFGSEYKTFDPLYNDKDEQALKEIKNYNTESTRNQGYFIGGREKPLRIVSPYMKKNGQGEIKLTNPINTKDYRTRADRDKANEKAIREYLDQNKGHDLFTVRSKQEIKESLESLLKPIELIEYPINNPKDYKMMPMIPGFPKKIPGFAKNIHMHSNPSFFQGRAYVQLTFGGTPEQLKPYIDEARSNSKVVILKSDLSHVYVKQFIDSKMDYADSLSALIPRSILTVKNTTVPMGKFIQERQDHPIDKFVDEIYELENQVLAEFNKVQIADEDKSAKYKRYFETRKRIEDARDALKPKQDYENKRAKDKVYPTYTEKENRKLQQQYLHRLSYNEDSVEIPDNYVLYVFDFGGSWNHPYSLGAAVSPDSNYIIYFCQQG